MTREENSVEFDADYLFRVLEDSLPTVFQSVRRSAGLPAIAAHRWHGVGDTAEVEAAVFRQPVDESFFNILFSSKYRLFPVSVSSILQLTD